MERENAPRKPSASHVRVHGSNSVGVLEFTAISATINFAIPRQPPGLMRPQGTSVCPGTLGFFETEDVVGLWILGENRKE